MFNKEAVDNILKGIVKANTAMGPFSLIIPAVSAAAVILLLLYCYKNKGRRGSAALTGFLAVIYIFSGGTILAGSGEMGSVMAWTGAAALWLVALLLVLDMVFHWTVIRLPERKDLKVISIFFMTAGIILYPLLEMLLGFTWPRMVFFSAECPTTIFLIGLFIGSIPKVNKPLFILVSVNAVFTGLSVAINGAPFDYLYALAGLAGIVMMGKYFREIFIKKKI
ncbi:MAG: hypothetical protein GXP33_15005 [Spirochaetes bacterium]|nr:hypothetical protein [Spirochaetota bacterium]